MKLYKSLLLSGLSTLILASTAQAAAARSNTPVTGEGLMECGRYFFVATVTSLPNKNLVFGNRYPGVVHYENANAEAVCGGEIIDTRKTAQERGSFVRSVPRFVQYKSVSEEQVGMIDRRTLTVGKSYKIACGNSIVSGKVADIRSGQIALVSFSFANTRAEELCGQGRYQEMGAVLDHTEAVLEAQLGFK